MGLGYIGTIAVRIFGKYLFYLFASKSPFMVEEYKSYFKGGVQDMSSQVIECWEYLIRWFKEGTFEHHFCKTVDFFGPVSIFEQKIFSCWILNIGQFIK